MPKLKRTKIDSSDVILQKNITPSKMNNASNAYLADGDLSLLTSIFEKALTDGHIKGVVKQLKDKFLRLRKKVVPSKFGDQTKAKEYANFVSNVFEEIDINDLVNSIFKSIIFGAGAIRTNWEAKDQLWLPISYYREDDTAFRVERKTKKIFRKKSGDLPELDLSKVDDFLTVVNSEDLYPIMFGVSEMYILKKYGVRLWISFIERFGSPILLVKYNKNDAGKALVEGETKTVLDEIYEQLDNFHAEGKAAFPSDQDLVLKESYRTTYDHNSLASQFCNSEITMAFLSQQNSVGGKGHQSRNNLDNHTETVHLSAMSYADQAFKIISDQLIPRIIKINLDANALWFPRLELDEPDWDLMNLAKEHGHTLSKEYFTSRGLELEEKSSDDASP